MDKILLLDGLNLIWRANINFKPKPEDEGKPSYTIVFTFFRMLRAMIEQFGPNKVYFAREGRDCFRYELFPEYKANRLIKEGNVKKLAAKENFDRQKKIIFKLISKLPIWQVKSDGFEADDVMATIAANATEDEEIVIVSTDSDLIQILQKGYSNVRLWHPGNKAFVEPPPYFYLGWKCMAGDKQTDNIPGLMSKAKAEKLARDPELFKAFLSDEENRANYNLNRALIELRIIDGEKIELIEPCTNYESLKNEFEFMEFDVMFKSDYWDRFVGTFKGLR